MIVFKNYFKIVKSFAVVIILYVVIFSTFAIAISSSSSSTSSFSGEKPNIAIINNDEDTLLLKAFEEYISNNSNIKEIQNDEISIKDALFYREAEYVLIIPDNYTSDFINGLNPKIETMKVPDSGTAIQAELLFNKFLNTANVYFEIGMTEKQVTDKINTNLNGEANVVITNSDSDTLSKIASFFNFTNYTSLALCITIVGMILNVFNNSNVKKRNLISSTTYKSINRQIFFANILLTIIMWLLFVVISIVVYKEAMFTNAGLLFMLNSLIFDFAALSIAFLLGNLIKSKEAQNGIVNILALGSSFLCGAFVPQSMLGDFVVNISKVLPSYWYIKTNNDIALLSNFSFENLSPIFFNMLVVVIFAVVFYIINSIISKLKFKK